MKRFWGKLDFIHRRLWHRDGLYRFALLLGPATLLGGGLAFALWAGVQVVGQAADHPPPWAPPLRSANAITSTGPLTVQPAYKLPSPDADKPAVGYETGWQVRLQLMEITPTLDATVSPTPLLGFTLNDPIVDMVQITARGPKGLLYAAVGSGLLAIRTPGTYTVSMGFQRPAGENASCLVRMALGSHRVVNNIDGNIVHDVSKTFTPGRFDLQPGLYPISWTFSCWHDRTMIGTGRITLLVSGPGEQKLSPVRLDDILRQTTIKP
jgi:hypothetical protein